MKISRKDQINHREIQEKAGEGHGPQAPGGWLKILVTVIAVAMSLFHLYTGLFGSFTAMIQRSVHVLFVLLLIFMLYPGRKGSGRRQFLVFDGIFFLLAVIVMGYLVVNYQALVQREGTPTDLDIWMGLLAIILVFEATRRVIGWPLVIITGAFLVYALAGPYFPGMLGHRGYDFWRIAYHMYLTTSGMFGEPVGVSANIIALFVLFGVFLEKSGAAKIFMDVAVGTVGWLRGGPAKAAVVGSALMGMVSGSAAANAATVGTFTIPLMKKNGYKSHVASAIEAVSSTGGQLMPPVMGTAAFVMAEFIQMPYIKVCVAALIPAILYYFTLFVMVDLEAVKAGLKGLRRDELPNVGKSLLTGVHLFLPLVVLVVLMAMQYSPIYAASRAIVVLFIVAMLKQSTRFNWQSLVAALEAGAKQVLSVAIACACAGMVAGVITLTGLGLKMSSLLVVLSGGNMLLLLILVMITSLILGMGLPTVACYILLGTLVGPALVNMGVPLLAAHMFILYFGCISAITPPVALAAYTSAGIGGANPNTTGFTAFKIGIAAFIIPYMFIYGPELLFNGGLIKIIPAAITACVGCFTLAAGMQGQLAGKITWWQRVFLVTAALLLIKPGLLTDLLGVGLLILVFVWQKWFFKQQKIEGLKRVSGV